MEIVRRDLLKYFARVGGGVWLSENLPTPTPTLPQAEATATPTPPPGFGETTAMVEAPDSLACKVVPGRSWTGRASYYSEKGCLGCSARLIMANGQRFDEADDTISFMRLPLGSQVLVTNLDNGISIKAIVTDRGGFESLGRIADLSKGLAERIGLITDVSKIKVSLLNCSQ